jgi:DNA-binding winged helix-turn-helix (wHTH) protein
MALPRFVGDSNYEVLPYSKIIEDLEYFIEETKAVIERTNSSIDNFYAIKEKKMFSDFSLQTKSVVGEVCSFLESFLDIEDFLPKIKLKKVERLHVEKIKSAGSNSYRLFLLISEKFNNNEKGDNYLDTLPQDVRHILEYGIYAELKDHLGLLMDCNNMAYELSKYEKVSASRKVMQDLNKQSNKEFPIEKADIEFKAGDFATFTDGSIKYKDFSIDLRTQLHHLLRLFIQHSNRLLNYDDLKEEVIGSKKKHQIENKTIQKYINQLRTILKEYTEKELISNKEGVGYIFKP